MSAALLNLFFNAMLAMLLVVTIGYCRKLSIKIRQLQDSRSELAEMINRFDTSTERATHSLGELQNVSKKITEALQLKIDKANFLADDLAFLIEKSTKLVTQLEQMQKQRTEPVRPSVSFTAEHPANASEKKYAAPASAPPPLTPSVASIEAMLQKLATHASGTRSTPPSEPAARTPAERELLSALKTGR